MTRKLKSLVEEMSYGGSELLDAKPVDIRRFCRAALQGLKDEQRSLAHRIRVLERLKTRYGEFERFGL